MSRVLMIEDEKSIRDEVIEWLELEGHEVASAGDGKAGVELALSHHPDIILCDIMMPIMDGYKVLIALRNNPGTASIPFIFLTAKADRSYVRHGMELGADDYLTKPFTRAELLSAIESRLKRHHATSEVHQQEMDNAKLKLTRLVTHELKTPLTAIQMIRDILSRQVSQLAPNEIAEMLDSLGSATDRLHHVVEQMVYLMQIETNVLNKQTIQAQGYPVAMWQILPTVVDLAKRFAHNQQEHDVYMDMRDQQAATLGQIQPLKHALAELVANALQHSPASSPVSLSQWVADKSIWITITDKGEGLTQEEIARALKPFDQVGREQQEQQGIGLGLTVARQIIDAHNGTFELRSAKGRGTQVIVQLPLAT